MNLNPRRVGLSLVVFLAVIGLGAWPSPGIALSFSAGYSSLANLLLVGHTFGERGHARLDPAPEIARRESDNVTADTVLSLSVDGYKGALPLGISLRRDVYLPLLIVVALVLAVPLGIRQRLTCLALAVPTTLLVGVAANALIAAWTFATQLKKVYPPDPVQRRLIEIAYSALLTPPGNRFIAPLVLGGGLIAWQLLRPGRPPGGRRPSAANLPDAQSAATAAPQA